MHYIEDYIIDIRYIFIKRTVCFDTRCGILVKYCSHVLYLHST